MQSIVKKIFVTVLLSLAIANGVQARTFYSPELFNVDQAVESQFEEVQVDVVGLLTESIVEVILEHELQTNDEAIVDVVIGVLEEASKYYEIPSNIVYMVMDSVNEELNSTAAIVE